MAYTTPAEVQSDFKDITFAAGKNVTDTDVTQFIVEADALINSKVGQIYVTPVTAGEGLQLLKLFSRSLVAERIKRLMEVKQQKSTDANQNVLSVLLSPAMVMKLLDDIAKKNTKLDGAVLLNAEGAFFNNNESNGVEPVFKKDVKQW